MPTLKPEYDKGKQILRRYYPNTSLKYSNICKNCGNSGHTQLFCSFSRRRPPSNPRNNIIFKNFRKR